jgi:hypothetical protein
VIGGSVGGLVVGAVVWFDVVVGPVGCVGPVVWTGVVVGPVGCVGPVVWTGVVVGPVGWLGVVVGGVVSIPSNPEDPSFNIVMPKTATTIMTVNINKELNFMIYLV